MKKILLLFLLSVSIHTQAQNEKYHRILLKGDGSTLVKQLIKTGVSLDHPHITNDGIIAELSEHELSYLRQNDFKVDVLISDLSAYYVQRNLQQSRTATVSPCNVPAVAKPAHFHLGNYAGYFSLTEMETILDSMALLYPSLITAKQPVSAIQSLENRNIWYVKISDNPSTDENEPEVLYTAVHHAREPLSLSQQIFYMWYLLEHYNTDPEIKAIVDNTEMYFVPCVNPDGYVFNQTTNPSGGGMWRKNRRLNSDGSYGVDLNRNYGGYWGYDNIGSSPTPTNDTYRGTNEFSEPETQAIRDFCISRHFDAALNAHTFGNDLVYPWSHIADLLTPDSITYANWGGFLTSKNRYVHGTCNQTLEYLTNGDSDDWMYTTMNTKNRIFAFTPESGGQQDGFWPASGRIIDLCKFTLEQNLNLAKLVLPCFVPTETTDHFITGSGYLRYELQKLGLTAGTATVSYQAVGSTISSFGPAKVYSNLSINQLISDSISFTLAQPLTAGQQISYVIKVSDGFTTHYDTLHKLFGTPTTLFSDNGNSTSTHFTTTGSAWDVDLNSYVSPPSCIVDGAGLYNGSENKRLSMSQAVNLGGALHAHLQYYIRYDVEKEYDKAKVLISTNGGVSFSPICAPRSTSPLSYAGTQPVYDGRQDDWVKEEIDLSAYIGQNVIVGFSLETDFFSERDGIYLDDILVRKLADPNATGISSYSNDEGVFTIYPNPGNGSFHASSTFAEDAEINVYNVTGQLIYASRISTGTTSIDLGRQAAGIYLLHVKTGSGDFTKKLVIEN